MENSSDSERAETDTDPERPPRFDSVVRWVEYIRANPPDVWGPQQNAVVDGQLESARAIEWKAENERQRPDRSRHSTES